MSSYAAGWKKHRLFASLALSLVSATALAQAPSEAVLKQQRCATRVSIALMGKAADNALLTNTNPQSQVDAFLAQPDFVERFSRFVNQQFNDNPGVTAEEDAPYWMSREILNTNKPWKDMFLGQYTVVRDPAQQNNANAIVVQSDANGLGYFRSPAWLKRYAGNELDGYKISTAYRIMQNTIGLKLVASTNAPNVDISAKGRQNAACAGCHYNSFFALDLASRVLTRRVDGANGAVTFREPPAADLPQTLLGTAVIRSDKDLVTNLVDSESFRFRACRMSFEFLYGRPEYACEGALFDKCMDEFTAKGTIQSALAVIAKDASFCQ